MDKDEGMEVREMSGGERSNPSQRETNHNNVKCQDRGEWFQREEVVLEGSRAWIWGKGR